MIYALEMFLYIDKIKQKRMKDISSLCANLEELRMSNKLFLSKS